MEWMQSAWFWWALALALFALEALAPGAFMLWLGFAALAAGLLQLLSPELGLVPQWILFGVFALVAVALGRRWRGRNPPAETDQPLLNRRALQLMDKVYPLDTPISNGRGRIKVGDAFWSVEGEDAPVGTRVRVIAVEGMTLRVRAVE
jgi:membrane protein implicated in regulation of membrane protease activity